MTPQEKRAHEYAKKASLCPGEFDVRFESYLQAEKDLALTWEDVMFISQTVTPCPYTPGLKEICEETLKRFNEQRKK